MKPVLLASVVAALCLATVARAQDVFVAFGERYRLTAVNSMFSFAPEGPAAAGKPARVLTHDEQLARCDSIVALALDKLGPGPGGVRFIRDRVEARPADRTWVIYAQRHQGYRIIGAGGRVELDALGRILFAGLTYESGKLRDFEPMASAKLKRLAAAALPRPRAGPPLSHELMIDPRPLRGNGGQGTMPAELRAIFVYELASKDNLPTEGWQVILNSETGKVVDSFSLTMRATPR